MSTTAKTELNDLNEKATELLKEKKDQENIINLSLIISFCRCIS